MWPSKGKYSRIMHCGKKGSLRTKSGCADDMWIDTAKPLARLNKKKKKPSRWVGNTEKNSITSFGRFHFHTAVLKVDHLTMLSLNRKKIGQD